MKKLVKAALESHSDRSLVFGYKEKKYGLYDELALSGVLFGNDSRRGPQMSRDVPWLRGFVSQELS